MRGVRCLLAAALFGAVVAAPVAAQRRSRSGFWMDGAVGYGRVRVVCLDCRNDRGADGTALTLSAGGSVSRYVLVGVEGQVWNGLASGLKERVRSVNLVAQWYPWGPHNGLFLRGGTGLVDGTVIASDSSGRQVTVQGAGVGISISLGIDVLLSRRLALTVQAGDQLSALGDLVAIGGLAADDTIAYLSRFSVGVTWR